MLYNWFRLKMIPCLKNYGLHTIIGNHQQDDEKHLKFYHAMDI
jgi:hypothetical protein